jgi:endonuclease/exonuclease/phosphatase (EEP) superfamily protein YafD
MKIWLADEAGFSEPMINRASVWVVLALVFTVVGCVAVPVSDQLIVSSGELAPRLEDASCSSVWQAYPGGSAETPALNPAGFNLMAWNVFKQREGHWSEDYLRLSRGQDILLLQEARLTPSLRALLGQSGYRWSMTHAFDYQGTANGVLTAGRSPASGTCLSRRTEPLIRIPKSALLTRYPLEGSSEALLVANLHGINFTLGTAPYRAQLEALERAMDGHTGPMILAGDFNDWSTGRSAIVSLVAQRLDLVPVQFTGDARSRYWGRPVDHVFYRGLEVVQARTVKVTSSDHSPVLVRFRLPSYPQE